MDIRLRWTECLSFPTTKADLFAQGQAIVILLISRWTSPFIQFHTTIKLSTPRSFIGAGGACRGDTSAAKRDSGEGGSSACTATGGAVRSAGGGGESRRSRSVTGGSAAG